MPVLLPAFQFGKKKNLSVSWLIISRLWLPVIQRRTRRNGCCLNSPNFFRGSKSGFFPRYPWRRAPKKKEEESLCTRYAGHICPFCTIFIANSPEGNTRSYFFPQLNSVWGHWVCLMYQTEGTYHRVNAAVLCRRRVITVLTCEVIHWAHECLWKGTHHPTVLCICTMF